MKITYLIKFNTHTQTFVGTAYELNDYLQACTEKFNAVVVNVDVL